MPVKWKKLFCDTDFHSFNDIYIVNERIFLKEILEILRYRLVWFNILLLIVSAVLMFEYKILSLLTYTLIINLYDILGYHFTLIRRSTRLPDKVIIRAYRIQQLIFEILVALFIALIFGLKYFISSLILKWFGIQDAMYYIFLQKQFPGKFTWMQWTPFGLIKGDLSDFEVIFQIVIGIIIAVLILIL